MNKWSNGGVKGKQKCGRCAVGYITVDAFNERLCLNCGARPAGWTSTPYAGKPDYRHMLPNEKWNTSPGHPRLLTVTLPIFFGKSSFATYGEDGRNRLYPLPERRRLMVLTYLEESFADRRQRRCYIPVWVNPRKRDEQFEWRGYPVEYLVAQFQQSFEKVTGSPLSHTKEFFQDEREEWLKSLRVPATRRS